MLCIVIYLLRLMCTVLRSLPHHARTSAHVVAASRLLMPAGSCHICLLPGFSPSIQVYWLRQALLNIAALACRHKSQLQLQFPVLCSWLHVTSDFTVHVPLGLHFVQERHLRQLSQRVTRSPVTTDVFGSIGLRFKPWRTHSCCKCNCQCCGIAH